MDNFRENGKSFQALKDELSIAEQKANLCRITLEKYSEALGSQSLDFESADLRGMVQTLHRVEKNVKKEKQRRRFFRANKIAKDISEQVDIVREIASELNEMNNQLRSIPQQFDLFRPDFSSIPKTKVPVHLDFSTASTMEGQLKDTLLENSRRSTGSMQGPYAPVTDVLGVDGMGGVGKTTALIGLAHDPDVRETFSAGGIYFLTIGKDATPECIVACLKEIVRSSGGKRKSEEIDVNGSLESAMRSTSSWFATRKVLFICDDLWQTSSSQTGYFYAFAGLLDHSPKSHLVVSTRSSAIASETNARIVFEPRASTGHVARGMFMKSAGLDEAVIHESLCEDQVRQVLELCGGVPLMISIAGAQVRKRRETPKASLKRLLRSLNDERLCLHEKQQGHYPSCFNQAVVASLMTIADVLKSSESFINTWDEYSRNFQGRQGTSQVDFVIDCFRRLCVFPRNAHVSEEVIFAAWCTSSKKLGWSVIDCLVDFHLLMEFEDAHGQSVFGLHDVLLEYCENTSKEGQDVKYDLYHREFLSYSWKLCHEGSSTTFDTDGTYDDCNGVLETFWDSEACERCRPWWSVLLVSLKGSAEIGNYLLSNLIRHLRESDRLAEAIGVLSHMGWTKLRIVHGGIAALNTDFSLVDNAIKKLSGKERDRKAREDARSGIMTIWDMIKRGWPIISRDSEALPTHAYGYLLDYDENMSSVGRYLQSAEGSVQDLWLKPQNAYWSLLDSSSDRDRNSSSDRRPFRFAEGLVGNAVVTGSQIMIAATTTTIFWVDMQTMTATREMSLTNEKRRESRLSAFAFCQSKGILVLGYSKGEMELRNERSGDLLCTVPHAHDHLVSSVAISTNGERVVSGSYDETVRVWDTESGEAVCETLRGHEDRVTSVAISADGRKVVSGSSDKTVRLWDVQSESKVHEVLYEHTYEVTCVAISADGRTAVSGGGKTICVWREDGEPAVHELPEKHENLVTSVALSVDGRTLVSGSWDTTVRVWDLWYEELVGEPLQGHGGSVGGVTISPDGRTIVAGFSGRALRSWDMGGQPVIRSFDAYCRSISMVQYRRRAASTRSGSAEEDDEDDEDDEIDMSSSSGYAHTRRTSSMRSGSTEEDDDDDEAEMHYMNFHRFMRRRSSRRTSRTESGSAEDNDEDESDMHSISRWTFRASSTGSESTESVQSETYGSATNVALCGNGQRIVCGSSRTVLVKEVKSGKTIGKPLRVHEMGEIRVAMSADGMKVVSMSDEAVRVWNMESGKAISLHMHLVGGTCDLRFVRTDKLTSVTVSADGRKVVFRSSDGRTRMWDTESGEVATFACPKRSNTVAMSADGHTVVSGCADGSVMIWIAGNETVIIEPLDSQRYAERLRETHVHRRRFDNGNDSVTSAATSADGRTVAWGLKNGPIRVWDADEGATSEPLFGHESAVLSLAVSAGRRTIVSGSRDGKVRVWRRSNRQAEWKCAYVCLLPRSWSGHFAYCDANECPEVVGKLYCLLNGGRSHAMFELRLPS